MGSIAAHAVFFIVLIGNIEHKGLGGHGGMERGVEHHRFRHLIAKQVPAGANALHVGLVVQRRQGDQAFDALDHLFVYQHGLAEQRPALHHAVADGGYLVQAFQHAVLRIDQSVLDLLEGGGMILHIHVLMQLSAVLRFVGEHTRLHADPFTVSLAQHLFGIHIDQLILQRRAACVDYENFHVLPLPFQNHSRAFLPEGSNFCAIPCHWGPIAVR